MMYQKEKRIFAWFILFIQFYPFNYPTLFTNIMLRIPNWRRLQMGELVAWGRSDTEGMEKKEQALQ